MRFNYIGGLLSIASHLAEKHHGHIEPLSSDEERLIVRRLVREVQPFWIEGVDWFEREGFSVFDAVSCRPDLLRVCEFISADILTDRGL